jgi:alkane 1-monooxygenase
MALFALASLAPLLLLGAGVGWGGVWALAGVSYMTVFAFLLDQAIPLVAPDAPEGAEFPAADTLLAVLGIGHLIALPAAVWAIAGDSGLATGERIALFFGFGMFFGQVSNPMAHELIHRGDRRLFRLGMAVYTSMLFGHHTSAHRHVHHRHAASPEDPNSAPKGMGFWRFLPRAWIGSFRAGLAAENALRARGASGLHPYAIYLVGGASALVLAGGIAGGAGVAVWVALSFYASSQLMLSDYVQHYGLVRATLANGKPEPVSDRHSWNAPHWFTSGVMLNAPRHSDHHAHPSRPYPALRLPGPDEAPWLPYSLPVCAGIALVPRLWRRMMDPRLARWEQRG